MASPLGQLAKGLVELGEGLYKRGKEFFGAEDFRGAYASGGEPELPETPERSSAELERETAEGRPEPSARGNFGRQVEAEAARREARRDELAGRKKEKLRREAEAMGFKTGVLRDKEAVAQAEKAIEASYTRKLGSDAAREGRTAHFDPDKDLPPGMGMDEATRRRVMSAIATAQAGGMDKVVGMAIDRVRKGERLPDWFWDAGMKEGFLPRNLMGIFLQRITAGDMRITQKKRLEQAEVALENPGRVLREVLNAAEHENVPTPVLLAADVIYQSMKTQVLRAGRDILKGYSKGVKPHDQKAREWTRTMALVENVGSRIQAQSSEAGARLNMMRYLGKGRVELDDPEKMAESVLAQLEIMERHEAGAALAITDFTQSQWTKATLEAYYGVILGNPATMATVVASASFLTMKRTLDALSATALRALGERIGDANARASALTFRVFNYRMLGMLNMVVSQNRFSEINRAFAGEAPRASQGAVGAGKKEAPNGWKWGQASQAFLYYLLKDVRGLPRQAGDSFEPVLGGGMLPEALRGLPFLRKAADFAGWGIRSSTRALAAFDQFFVRLIAGGELMAEAAMRAEARRPSGEEQWNLYLTQEALGLSKVSLALALQEGRRVALTNPLSGLGGVVSEMARGAFLPRNVPVFRQLWDAASRLSGVLPFPRSMFNLFARLFDGVPLPRAIADPFGHRLLRDLQEGTPDERLLAQGKLVTTGVAMGAGAAVGAGLIPTLDINLGVQAADRDKTVRVSAEGTIGASFQFGNTVIGFGPSLPAGFPFVAGGILSKYMTKAGDYEIPIDERGKLAEDGQEVAETLHIDGTRLAALVPALAHLGAGLSALRQFVLATDHDQEEQFAMFALGAGHWWDMAETVVEAFTGFVGNEAVPLIADQAFLGSTLESLQMFSGAVEGQGYDQKKMRDKASFLLAEVGTLSNYWRPWLRGIDPYKRSYDPMNVYATGAFEKFGQWLEYTKNRAMSVTPWLSQQLPIRYDPFGGEMRHRMGMSIGRAHEWTEAERLIGIRSDAPGIENFYGIFDVSATIFYGGKARFTREQWDEAGLPNNRQSDYAGLQLGPEALERFLKLADGDIYAENYRLDIAVRRPQMEIAGLRLPPDLGEDYVRMQGRVVRQVIEATLLSPESPGYNDYLLAGDEHKATIGGRTLDSRKDMMRGVANSVRRLMRERLAEGLHRQDLRFDYDWYFEIDGVHYVVPLSRFLMDKWDGFSIVVQDWERLKGLGGPQIASELGIDPKVGNVHEAAKGVLYDRMNMEDRAGP